MMPLALPVIFLLSSHLRPEELHALEDRIPTLTYDANEAEVVLGRVSRKQRALFELRRLKLETEPLSSSGGFGVGPLNYYECDERETKRPKLNLPAPRDSETKLGANHDIVRVLNLSWLTESMEKEAILPMSKYTVYEGRKVGCRAQERPEGSPTGTARAILKRAADDKAGAASKYSTGYNKEEVSHTRNVETTPTGRKAVRPSFIRQTTFEHDINPPPIPEFLRTTYSCQRPTPVDSVNLPFITELKGIRTLRLLQGDKIGVRAYSTSISSIAAYPHKISSPQEVARLPGCGHRIAEVYQEWYTTGQTAEMRNSDTDPKASVLKVFYGIWGVGDINAREFYNKGWTDLDDVVEHGWQTLSRVQQIGVKFYEEFQQKIGREEVARIGGIILDHARRLDRGYEMTIVGGYRRRKEKCGDVDVILSHRKEEKTLRLVENLVLSLERGNYISHTLSLSTRNSERGQEPLPWKGEGRTWSTGFDTLDKAMVVWRDSTQSNALHRRVDIIVSPWKTVGCALLGWSGETTFERDLRRYCKKEKGLKFDSSGIRSRADGSWVDFESGNTPVEGMEEAERRVFDGLGIPWRYPWERCTG